MYCFSITQHRDQIHAAAPMPAALLPMLSECMVTQSILRELQSFQHICCLHMAVHTRDSIKGNANNLPFREWPQHTWNDKKGKSLRWEAWVMGGPGQPNGGPAPERGLGPG